MAPNSFYKVPVFPIYIFKSFWSKFFFSISNENIKYIGGSKKEVPAKYICNRQVPPRPKEKGKFERVVGFSGNVFLFMKKMEICLFP